MLVVDPTKRTSLKKIMDHPFMGDTKEVLPDLLASQVPEFQHVPINLISIEPNDECNNNSETN